MAVALLVGVFLLPVTTAAAGSYGAIAFSRSTGRYGYASGKPEKDHARAGARSACGVSDCRVMVWFRDKCGALARSTKGTALGWAHDRSAKKARSIARAKCAERARDCKVIAWTCSGGS